MTGRLLLLGTLILAAACGGGREPDPEILVFAAASTVDAMDAALEEFDARHHTISRASYGPTSTLARQIAAGAPADLFLSADRRWGDHVADEVDVAARHELVGNSLVVVVPGGSSATRPGPSGTDDEDVLRRLSAPEFERIAVADPEAVPAGIYAREALTAADLWSDLEPRLLPSLDVRAALALVERGEADAGIVYRSDAVAEDGVEILGTVDPRLHSPIVYPLLLLEGSSRLSRRLFEFLTSAEGLEPFLIRGFTRPGANAVPSWRKEPAADGPELSAAPASRRANRRLLRPRGHATIAHAPTQRSAREWSRSRD